MSLFIRLLRFILKYLLSLGIVSYAMTLGMFTRKGRSLLPTLLNLYDLTIITNRTKVTINRLPSISYNRVIANDSIEVIEPLGKDGNVTLEELVIINGIIKKEHPKQIFEIGTFDGRTTINMANSSQDECKVHTLDLQREELENTKYEIGSYDKTLVDKEISGERIIRSSRKCRDKISQLFGDSATFNFTPFFDCVELVFIDGAHDYQNAVNDSETALMLVGKRNGIILWHDYDFSVASVMYAIETFGKAHPELHIYHIQETKLAYCRVHSSLHYS